MLEEKQGKYEVQTLAQTLLEGLHSKLSENDTFISCES